MKRVYKDKKEGDNIFISIQERSLVLVSVRPNDKLHISSYQPRALFLHRFT